MKRHIIVFACVAAGMLAACFRTNVRTMAAPRVTFAGLTTYRQLPLPALRYGSPAPDPHDPMVDGAANRMLRDRVAAMLETRGYLSDEQAPDIDVAFYATISAGVDITRWSYGYPFVPDWPRWPLPPLPSSDGRIVVDVLQSSTKILLWRGEATTRLTKDPDENLRRIADLTVAVVERVPLAARRRTLASR